MEELTYQPSWLTQQKAFLGDGFLPLVFLLLAYVFIVFFALKTKRKETHSLAEYTLYTLILSIMMLGAFCTLNETKEIIRGVPALGMAKPGILWYNIGDVLEGVQSIILLIALLVLTLPIVRNKKRSFSDIEAQQ